MGAERLPMRRIREVLRLKYAGGLSHRAIAVASGVGLGTVWEYVERAGGGLWRADPGSAEACHRLEAAERALDPLGAAGRPLDEMARSLMGPGMSAVLG